MSTAASDLKQLLTAAVGNAGFVEREAIVIPADIDAVVAVARICADTRTPMAIASSSSGTAHGAPEPGIIISLNRLAALSLAAGNLTLRAEAGATVAAARAAAEKEHLAIVGLPENVEAEHVGTLVVRGAIPRRALSGIEAVLPTGERVSAGGAVLKDVVGYDLATVLLGSMGSLAIVVAATFRLEPAQARTPVSPPVGMVAGRDMVTRAFDPQGLLRPRM